MAEQLRRHGERASRGFQRRFVVLGLACAAVIGLIPVAHYYRWYSKPAEAVSDGAPPKQPDLVIPEAVLVGQGQGRRIEGSVLNKSANRYTDVRIVFTIRRADGAQLAPVAAVLDRVEPSHAVRFQSEPVPLETNRYYVREISGTAR